MDGEYGLISVSICRHAPAEPPHNAFPPPPPQSPPSPPPLASPDLAPVPDPAHIPDPDPAPTPALTSRSVVTFADLPTRTGSAASIASTPTASHATSFMRLPLDSANSPSSPNIFLEDLGPEFTPNPTSVRAAPPGPSSAATPPTPPSTAAATRAPRATTHAHSPGINAVTSWGLLNSLLQPRVAQPRLRARARYHPAFISVLSHFCTAFRRYSPAPRQRQSRRSHCTCSDLAAAIHQQISHSRLVPYPPGPAARGRSLGPQAVELLRAPRSLPGPSACRAQPHAWVCAVLRPETDVTALRDDTVLPLVQSMFTHSVPTSIPR